MPHRAVRSQSTGKFVEIDGPLLLVNLYGIPAAERDVRSSFAGQVNELMTIARSATGARYRRLDLREVVGPYIVRQKCSADLVACANQQFEGFGGGDRGDKVHGRIQNARGVAGLDHAARRLGKDTGEAGGGRREGSSW